MDAVFAISPDSTTVDARDAMAHKQVAVAAKTRAIFVESPAAKRVPLAKLAAKIMFATKASPKLQSTAVGSSGLVTVLLSGTDP